MRWRPTNGRRSVKPSEALLYAIGVGLIVFGFLTLIFTATGWVQTDYQVTVTVPGHGSQSAQLEPGESLVCSMHDNDYVCTKETR